MKRKWTILFLILISIPFPWGSCATVGIEKAPYEVITKQGVFEVRRYKAQLVTETIVDSNFGEAGNIAFRRLFDYISGKNRSRQSIAMTAPVKQEPRKGKFAVSFVMPAEYTLKTLPKPIDPAVMIRGIPARKIAAVRYSGTWSQKRYKEKKAQLEQFIQEKELTSSGPDIFARYDPPFQIWFLRRNEVLIPVE